MADLSAFADDGYISVLESDTLMLLIEATGTDLDGFLTEIKVASLGTITPHKYTKALALLATRFLMVAQKKVV